MQTIQDNETTLKVEDPTTRPKRYEIPDWIPRGVVPKIFPAMIMANRAVNAVTKSRKNQQQNYSFRGIDQVYDMIHEAFADAGIITAPVVLQRKTTTVGKTQKGGEIILTEIEAEYWCYAEDGSALIIGPLWAEGLDSSDKGTNKCLSFAQKYAILQTFTVPTSDVAEGDKVTIDRNRAQQDGGQQQQDGPAQDNGPNETDMIDAETASKVYTAFASLGVTKEQLHAKLEVTDVSKLPRSSLQQIAGWRDELQKDKRNAARIFGEPAPQQRADALNGPPTGTT